MTTGYSIRDGKLVIRDYTPEEVASIEKVPLSAPMTDAEARTMLTQFDSPEIRSQMTKGWSTDERETRNT